MFRIRSNSAASAVAIGGGSLMVLIAAISFGYGSNTSGPDWFDVVWAILGVGAVFSGIAQLKGEFARVSPTSVEMRNELVGAGRSYPIAGLGDLYFDGNTLRRRGDGQKLVTFKPRLTNATDVAQLRSAIAYAQNPLSPDAAAPPRHPTA